MLRHKVQFVVGAPVIMNMMLNYEHPILFKHRCCFVTGGSAPPPALMDRMKQVTAISVRSVSSSYAISPSVILNSRDMASPKHMDRALLMSVTRGRPVKVVVTTLSAASQVTLLLSIRMEMLFPQMVRLWAR